MKRAITLVLPALAISALAQPTILFTENEPVIGDTFIVKWASVADPGPAGAGANYDYSTLVEAGTRTYEYIDPAVYDNPAMFPTANIALTDGVNDTLFYSKTTTEMTLVGEDSNLSGFGYAAALAPAPKVMQWPLMLNDNWNGSIGSSFLVDGGTPFTRVGAYTAIADGAGTLTLPGALPSMEVLRVNYHSEETNNGGFVTVTRKKDIYSYHTPFLQHPALRVIYDSISSTIGVDLNTITTEWIDGSYVSVPEKEELAFTMFPVPAGSAVQVTSMRVISRIEVMDALGKLHVVGIEPRNSRSRVLEVSRLNSGMYTVRVIGTDGSIGTKRLIVQH